MIRSVSLELLCPILFWQKLGYYLGLCGKVYLLRIHDGDNAKYGDPYIWCLTVLEQHDYVLLKGAWRKPASVQEWYVDYKTIAKALSKLRYKTAIWEREVEGKQIVLDLTKYKV